jgi:hypothetical protein
MLSLGCFLFALVLRIGPCRPPQPEDDGNATHTQADTKRAVMTCSIDNALDPADAVESSIHPTFRSLKETSLIGPRNFPAASPKRWRLVIFNMTICQGPSRHSN